MIIPLCYILVGVVTFNEPLPLLSAERGFLATKKQLRYAPVSGYTFEGTWFLNIDLCSKSHSAAVVAEQEAAPAKHKAFEDVCYTENVLVDAFICAVHFSFSS